MLAFTLSRAVRPVLPRRPCAEDGGLLWSEEAVKVGLPAKTGAPAPLWWPEDVLAAAAAAVVFLTPNSEEEEKEKEDEEVVGVSGPGCGPDTEAPGA